MMILAPLSPRLCELVSALCDGVISDSDFAELQGSLTDPTTLRGYVRYIQLHGSLLASTPEANDDMHRLLKQFQPTIEVKSVEPTKPRSPILGFFGGMVHAATRSPLVTTLLVAVLIYGAFTYLAWDLRSKSLSTGLAGDSAVALISNSADVRWSPQVSAKPNDASIQAGEPLKIESGMIEVELKAGTKLVVEGPAEFEIYSENRGFLRRGMLVATVPKLAVGFTIETPTAKIVDLGTEFGVEVKDSGETGIHVFRGAVETTEVVPLSKQHRDSGPVQLKAGQSMAYGGSVSHQRPVVDKKSFPRLSQHLTRRTEPQLDSYVQTVLADRPLAYWPLNEPVGSTEVADLSGNGHVGKVKGKVVFGCEWPVCKPPSSAARFEGNGWIEIANPTDLALERNFTVEAWLMSAAETCEAPEHILSISNWGWGRAPSHLRACPLFRSDKHFGTIGEVRFDLPEWRHVAIILDSNDCVCWYVEGHRFAMQQEQIVAAQEAIQATIGVGPSNTGFWNGSIAHLAVYARALDATAIAKHLQSATRPSRKTPLEE